MSDEEGIDRAELEQRCTSATTPGSGCWSQTADAEVSMLPWLTSVLASSMLPRRLDGITWTTPRNGDVGIADEVDDATEALDVRLRAPVEQFALSATPRPLSHTDEHDPMEKTQPYSLFLRFPLLEQRAAVAHRTRKMEERKGN